jgi:hypothetical protein
MRVELSAYVEPDLDEIAAYIAADNADLLARFSLWRDGVMTPSRHGFTTSWRCGSLTP